MAELRTYIAKTGTKGTTVTDRVSQLSDGRVRHDMMSKGSALAASEILSIEEATSLRDGLSRILAPTPPTPNDPFARPGWQIVFLDTFDQNVAEGSFRAARADAWEPYGDDWPDTSKLGVRDSRTVSQSNGQLRIRHYTRTDGKPVAPALQPKVNGVVPSYTQARYEFRCKADSTIPGFGMANLLWPVSEAWPRDGEIDFPECPSSETVKCYMHRQNGTSPGDQDYFDAGVRLTDWHTYAWEWKAGMYLRLFVDDILVTEFTSRVPATPMRWVFQTETYSPKAQESGYLSVEHAAIWVPA